MNKVLIACSRCHKTIEGMEDEKGTSGFYRVEPGQYWHKYANPGEGFLCDACMWADPRWQCDYGTVNNG